MIEFAQQIQKLHDQRLPFVIVTLVRIRGSAPQIEGAKMLVTEQGLAWGTVGGGKIESHCLLYAQNVLKNEGASILETWNLQSDIGMSCGGEVTLFFDVAQLPRWHVSIFGAGHISQELCRILSTWSCQVSVFDTRPDWLEKLSCSYNITRKLSGNMSKEVTDLPNGSYLICMTMGHATDLPILHQALLHNDKFSFIGVIGSKIKSSKLKAELYELGVSENLVRQLHSPLGLPIGNNQPSEIAVSICAQILALRDKKSFAVLDGTLM